MDVFDALNGLMVKISLWQDLDLLHSMETSTGTVLAYELRKIVSQDAHRSSGGRQGRSCHEADFTAGPSRISQRIMTIGGNRGFSYKTEHQITAIIK